MLIQCPTCQHVHKTKADKKRWHCVECGTLWDGTGRVVTGRAFPKNHVSDKALQRSREVRTAKSGQTEAREKNARPNKKDRSFWEADLL